MTKEKIIVDDVDVSVCPDYIEFNTYIGVAHTPVEKGDCRKCYRGKCAGSDCKFKQIQKLTRQVDDLKSKNETWQKIFDDPEFKIAAIDVSTGNREHWVNSSKRYREALEEIQLELSEIISTSFFNVNDIENVINKITEVLNNGHKLQ